MSRTASDDVNPSTAILRDASSAIQQRFAEEKRVLSFDEYLELLAAKPAVHTRDAARYLRDCFDHFGSYEVKRPWAKLRRFGLFDAGLDPAHTDAGDDRNAKRDYLVGNEEIQERVYRILSNFAREGRSSRLILLHGPNGSAKSTFAACLMRGLERYSLTDEGALYRFSWVFPRGRDSKTIGFGPNDKGGPLASFAHLPDQHIESRLVSELREHPLLLLPIEERRRVISSVLERTPAHEKSEPTPDWIWSGQLGHKNRQVFEALLTNYRGDLSKVLAHVQVERYAISRRYRVGAVTIGPQMAVDARERQISADRSLGSLPASLSALSLYESVGELVDGAGGVIEFSDLLKRPLDAWKYLLLAIETGEAALELTNLPVNSVMVASANDVHLNAFREHHEYNSFRGRIVFVRVPYLIDYQQEKTIYDAQIVPQVRKHTAPHATYVASLWAVLTRLRRSQAERYTHDALGNIAADLTPMEKAELYADGRIPERMSPEQTRDLSAGIGDIRREFDSIHPYEGSSGASARELRTLLLDAAQDEKFACFSASAVLRHLELLCQGGDYDFLKEAPDRGFHDARGFLPQVTARWLAKADDEFRTATGLVEDIQYRELFDRYITHVSDWLKKEKVLNKVTGKYDEPDAELMASIEKMLDISDERRDDFRKNLISLVAAHAIDNPGSKPDFTRLFPQHIHKFQQTFFAERSKQLGTIANDALAELMVAKGAPEKAAAIDPERVAAARSTIERMKKQFGYCDLCVRETLDVLLREKYAP